MRTVMCDQLATMSVVGCGKSSHNGGGRADRRRGRAHRVDELPAFVALDRGERVGLLTYRLDGDTVEIVTLDSLREASA